MKEQLLLLIELQRLESSAAQTASRKRELPLRLSELESAFQMACNVLKEAEEAQEALNQRKREQDVLLQKGQDAIRKAKDRLSEVKTNKEYQSILKEIETIEHRNSQVEDETIALLDALEVKEKEVKVKQSTLADERRRFEEERADLEGELNSLAGVLAERQKKIETLKAQVPPALLKKYEQVKAAGRGVAVVPVWKEVCEGCHMSIPPQLYNELQKCKTLLTCPNCSRIIYWENRNGKTA